MFNNAKIPRNLTFYSALHYPRTLDALGERFDQRNLSDLVRRFLYLQDNPDNDEDMEEIPLTECSSPYGSCYKSMEFLHERSCIDSTRFVVP